MNFYEAIAAKRFGATGASSYSGCLGMITTFHKMKWLLSIRIRCLVIEVFGRTGRVSNPKLNAGLIRRGEPGREV